METPLVINIDTGVVAFRTAENAAQCNCRPISPRHARMVESGELPLAPLLAAIKKHMMGAADFDYEAYAEARRSLNVRHADIHAEGRAPVADADSDDYVTDAEVHDEMARPPEQDGLGGAVEAAADEVFAGTRARARPARRAKAPAQGAEEGEGDGVVV